MLNLMKTKVLVFLNAINDVEPLAIVSKKNKVFSSIFLKLLQLIENRILEFYAVGAMGKV